jgi:hypothetical protein
MPYYFGGGVEEGFNEIKKRAEAASRKPSRPII